LSVGFASPAAAHRTATTLTTRGRDRDGVAGTCSCGAEVQEEDAAAVAAASDGCSILPSTELKAD
jgi:hypothetical protein